MRQNNNLDLMVEVTEERKIGDYQNFVPNTPSVVTGRSRLTSVANKPKISPLLNEDQED